LRQMQRPATSRVDLGLAREIAQRQGIKAVVDGTVTGVGGSYILTLRLLAADSGVDLASFRETGDGPRGLIDAADKLARALRGKIGESLRAVQATPPLAQATTSSLDALRKYSAAVRANQVEAQYVKAVCLSREGSFCTSATSATILRSRLHTRIPRTPGSTKARPKKPKRYWRLRAAVFPTTSKCRDVRPWCSMRKGGWTKPSARWTAFGVLE